MNHIVDLRAELQRIYDLSTLVEDTDEVIFSPTRHFRLETVNYLVPKSAGNWELTKVTIFNHAANEAIFTFFSNWGDFFHSWSKKGDDEFLICAEDIYGGQTVIDLTNRIMSGYSPNEDGFIWTEHHLSPDGAILATIGCCWACPYVIKLYDSSRPLELPLKEIKEIKLLGNDETFVGWIDNNHFRTKGEKGQRLIDIYGHFVEEHTH
jgi:hypothetical protein